MKIEHTTIPATHGDHGGAQTLTVGSVRRLLQKASTLSRLPRVDDRVTNRQAIAAIRQALDGRPSGAPVSLLVAALAEALAGLSSSFWRVLCELPGDMPPGLLRPPRGRLAGVG